MRRSTFTYANLWALSLAAAACGAGEADTIDLPLNQRCLLPIEVGPCDAAIPRWAYDDAVGACVPFTYGGCDGNANNFESYEACRTACGGAPAVCGGLTCGEGEYCYYEAGAGCGAADQTGVCREIPDADAVCTLEYEPVCGCDGVTYGNACFAAVAGVSVAREGTCGAACGASSSGQCGPKEFCDFEAPGCDFNGDEGVCTLRPTVCTDEVDPVCGCDGVTYSNLCEAHAAGTDIVHTGECPGACLDQRRETVIEGGSLTFGECAGACQSRLTIFASPLLIAGACDVAQVEVCDNGTDHCTETTGTLTQQGHDRARAIARGLRGAPLDAIYGCPDCADGGASSVVLIRDNATFETTYETRKPPAVLQDADAFVQGLIQSLRTCAPSPMIEIESSCQPR